MNVRELIVRLQHLDQEMLVTTASGDFGLVALQLLNQLKVVPIATQHHVTQYRPTRTIDVAEQLTVLCCGPSDPNFVGEAPTEPTEIAIFEDSQERIRRDCQRMRDNCNRQHAVMAQQIESTLTMRAKRY